MSEVTRNDLVPPMGPRNPLGDIGSILWGKCQGCAALQTANASLTHRLEAIYQAFGLPLADTDDGLLGLIQQKRSEARESANLAGEIAELTKRLESVGTVEDGFGSVWPPCEEHGAPIPLSIIRPGTAVCTVCEELELLRSAHDARKELCLKIAAERNQLRAQFSSLTAQLQQAQAEREADSNALCGLRTYIGKIGAVALGGHEAEGQGRELDAVIALRAKLQQAQAEGFAERLRVVEAAAELERVKARVGELRRQLDAETDRADKECWRNRDEEGKWLMTRDANKAVTAELERYKQADAYARRLFLLIAPQCECLDSPDGVISQLDNYIAGQRDALIASQREAAELRELVEEARSIIIERGESTDVPLQFRQHAWLDRLSRLTPQAAASEGGGK